MDPSLNTKIRTREHQACEDKRLLIYIPLILAIFIVFMLNWWWEWQNFWWKMLLSTGLLFLVLWIFHIYNSC